MIFKELMTKYGQGITREDLDFTKNSLLKAYARKYETLGALTNMLGDQPSPLASGSEYRFPVRPQQIVTLRLKTKDSAPPVEALRTFDPIVPEAKRVVTRTGFDRPELKGHPPLKPGEEKIFLDLEPK